MTSREIRAEWAKQPCFCGHPNKYRCADPFGDNVLNDGCRCDCHDMIAALYAVHQPEPAHISVAVNEFLEEIRERRRGREAS